MIKQHDIVSVHFHNAKLTLVGRAEVLYLPQMPGDSWIFKDLDYNLIHYVSEGCTVTKAEQNEQND